MKRLRLAVLVSGGGRSLQNLIDRERAGGAPWTVVHVFASRAGVGAVRRAAAAGIPVTVCDPHGLTAHVDALDPDLVVMAGYLRKWPIPDRWIGKTINIHPALLPEFGGRGLYGNFVHAAVIAAGKKVTGCTVHFVTPEYDAGPVILQRTCAVLPEDTPETLAARVFEQELIALPEAISRIAAGEADMKRW